MSILLTQLVADTRILSDTVNVLSVTDTNVAMLLSDAGAELYDIFTAENNHYNISTFDFTLSGGVGTTNGLNSWDLSATPGDFQQGHSLEINPNTPNPITVKYLSNWLDRNNSAGGITFAGNGLSREYRFSGDLLKVFPPTNAAGQYRLYYTPKWQTLALPVFTLEAATTVEIGDTYTSDGATTTLFITDGVIGVPGDTIITNWSGNNAIFNGTYTIASLSNPQTCVVTPAGPIGSSTSPMAGANYQVGSYSQPTDTRSTLPAQMNPWSLYLKTHAAIAIRSKRQQSVDDLEMKLNGLKARVASILQNRQEEPTQPPLTRGSGDWLGGSGWSF